MPDPVDDLHDLINDAIDDHGHCALTKDVVSAYYETFVEGLARLSIEYGIQTTATEDTLMVVLFPARLPEHKVVTMPVLDTSDLQ